MTLGPSVSEHPLLRGAALPEIKNTYFSCGVIRQPRLSWCELWSFGYIRHYILPAAEHNGARWQLACGAQSGPPPKKLNSKVFRIHDLFTQENPQNLLPNYIHQSCHCVKRSMHLLKVTAQPRRTLLMSDTVRSISLFFMTRPLTLQYSTLISSTTSKGKSMYC